MSTVALSRQPSRTAAAFTAVVALGRSIMSLISRTMRTGRDARALSALPDHVLADMGLEKMEIMSGTNGSREIWVIPHRYY